jgi:aspartate aminotransferase-like enzyme
MTVLFTPGPVDVSPEVLAAQAIPMVPQDSKEFKELYRSTAERLQPLFFTRQPVYQIVQTAAGMQEIAIRNLVQNRVLCCVNGPYAERWGKIAEANGKEVELLEFGLDEPIDAQSLSEKLRSKPFDAVTIVHNEAGSGVMNPVDELSEAIHLASPQTLVLVDASSSLGGVKIEMDNWRIDYLFTTSYQCLALPPGMAFAAVSPRALSKAETVSQRGWTTDLLFWERMRHEGEIPQTTSIPLVYALDVQLDRILLEGIEKRFARHAALANHLQTWGEAHELPPFAPTKIRSITVTALRSTRFYDFDALDAFIQSRGMRIAPGYGSLRSRTFRVAHMGDTMMEDLDVLLGSMEEFFK